MKKFYFLTLALICAFAANAADLYIFGSFNGWNPAQSTKMTFANNVYTAEIEFSGDCNFGLATVQSSDWDNVVNKNRYGAATDNQVLVAGKATNLSKNSNAIKVPYAAKWTITVSADFKTVTATTDVAETYPEKIYILGNNVEGNNWSTSKGPEMSHQEDGVYTISGVTINGADGGQYGYFSFAEKVGANWVAVNAGTRWGPNAENKLVVLGTADTGLTNNWAGATQSWKIEPGVYDMILNTKELTLLVTQSVVATPVITMDENDMISITCATDDATIYYTIDGTTPTTSSTEYTEAFKLEGGATVKAIAVKDGWANSATASEALVPTAIEEVGVDAGEAVYYNLQGVKVANPENGIFIKKQGNKTTKVVL